MLHKLKPETEFKKEGEQYGTENLCDWSLERHRWPKEINGYWVRARVEGSLQGLM